MLVPPMASIPRKALRARCGAAYTARTCLDGRDAPQAAKTWLTDERRRRRCYYRRADTEGCCSPSSEALERGRARVIPGARPLHRYADTAHRALPMEDIRGGTPSARPIGHTHPAAREYRPAPSLVVFSRSGVLDLSAIIGIDCTRARIDFDLIGLSFFPARPSITLRCPL